MKIYYNSIDKNCKSRIGAISCGNKVSFKVYTKFQKFCNLHIKFEDLPEQIIAMDYANGFYHADFKFTKSGKYSYCFNIDYKFLVPGKFRNAKISDTASFFRQTVYKSGYKTPDWIKGKVMYQIFPDRFFRSKKFMPKTDPRKILRDDWGGMPEFLPKDNIIKNDDFFGGNLKGISEKLLYLKNLGISVIYLNPIFESASNHRYDTGDYFKIDSYLGTNNHFKQLINKAKKMGMRIIIDGVFSHTGSDSIYFNKNGTYKNIGAYQSKKSQYYKWYSFDKYPDKYSCWWGIKTLPQVNELNKNYQEFICGKNGVLNYWKSYGVDGIRLDVADELPDKFLEKVRKCLKYDCNDFYILGEVWEDATDKFSYGIRRKHLEGKTLDSVMNYPLKDAIISTVLYKDFKYFRECVLNLIDNYPKQSLDCLMNILGTHDTARIITVLSQKTLSTKHQMSSFLLDKTDKEKAYLKLKAATLLLFTVFGVPCIYYGDEIGTEGFADPFNRKCFDWDNTNGQFNNWYKKLNKIRKLSVYKFGEYKELYADKNCLVFERRDNKNFAITAVNLGNSEYELTFKKPLKDLISGKVYNDKFLLTKNQLAVLTVYE